jgi:AraC-like DNA-binding protein
MDVISGLLDGPRAQGAFLLRSLLEPPWSLRIQDEAPLTLVALVRGHAWVMFDGAEPIRLDAGSVAITSGTDPYSVADSPETKPQIIIHPGQRCTTPDGFDLHEAMSLGVRSWGNSRTGSTVMLTGTYQFEGEVSRRLLAALPTRLALDAAALDSPLVEILASEIVRDAPGQPAVLDRLLDLLLITTLRTWFNRPEANAPAWYRSHGDPIVGPAVRLLQHNPSHSWTIASLASEVGVSRATLARRFSEVMGEPPMTYLSSWRLTLAADLLKEPAATVTSVARALGYASPYALSTAFKRTRGISPMEHRRLATSA